MKAHDPWRWTLSSGRVLLVRRKRRKRGLGYDVALHLQWLPPRDVRDVTLEEAEEFLGVVYPAVQARVGQAEDIPIRPQLAILNGVVLWLP